MRKLKKRELPEIPLASTADVAFLLLIFFLVAASAGTDRGLPLDLPGTERSKDLKEVENLEITIKPDMLLVGAKPLEQDEDLVEKIRFHLEGKINPEERVVLIQADDAVSYQRWTEVVSAVELAGGIPAPQIEEAGGEASPGP